MGSVVFGAELRRLRTEASLSLAGLAERIHYHRGYISKIENGVKRPTLSFATACDAALGTGSSLQSYCSAQHRYAPPIQSRATDGSATERVLVPVVIDGRTVLVPLDRRTLLRAEAALTAGALTSAPALRPSSSRLTPEIPDHLLLLRSTLVQSDSLLGPGRLMCTVAEQVRNVEEMLAMADGAVRDQMFEIASMFAEFQGWLLDDVGDRRAGRSWGDRALEWAEVSGNPALVSYTLMRKSQQAATSRDAALTLGLAEAAIRCQSRGVPRRVVASATLQAAHGHALAGDERKCLRALDQALQLIDTDEPLDKFGLASHCTAAYLHAQRGACLSTLGQFDSAVDAFDAALHQWPEEYRRERGLHLARKASALVDAQRPEHAVSVAHDALAIAQDTGSARTVTELHRVAAGLEQWQSAEICVLREAITQQGR